MSTMQIKIGSKVKRNTTDYLQDEVGTVIDLDEVSGRARIKWDDKRTWFKISKLILVD